VTTRHAFRVRRTTHGRRRTQNETERTNIILWSRSISCSAPSSSSATITAIDIMNYDATYARDQVAVAQHHTHHPRPPIHTDVIMPSHSRSRPSCGSAAR
jgi:hypothetical protein